VDRRARARRFVRGSSYGDAERRRTDDIWDTPYLVDRFESVGQAHQDGSVHTLVRPDVYPRSIRYDPDRVLSLDMGPHPLWQLESLLPALQLQSGDRVLDLGCGRGATSVFLAREADVDVVAS